MEYTLNIQDLFQQAFGLRRPIYVVGIEPPIFGRDGNYQTPKNDPSLELKTDNVPTSKNSYKQPPTIFQLQLDEGNAKSSLGTVVLNTVKFRAGSYKERLNDGRIITSSYPELMLPPATVVEVNLKKVVIKTPLVSGKGTFKEDICFDDFDVRIRSVFTGNSVDEVETFLRRLMEMLTIPKEIKVASDYLNLLGVDYLVIENIVPQQMEGRPLMLPVEISCISDNPLQLNLGN